LCVVEGTNDESLEHVLAVVSPFLAHMGDEYRISVVKSIQQLCQLYYAKHRVLLGLLGKLLRGEGGLEFKRFIVAGIAKLMSMVPETAESALLHLCELVEDSEYARLTTGILCVAGTLGPKTSRLRLIPYI
jgi:coatomer protein complex subunit gamma